MTTRQARYQIYSPPGQSWNIYLFIDKCNLMGLINLKKSNLRWRKRWWLPPAMCTMRVIVFNLICAFIEKSNNPYFLCLTLSRRFTFLCFLPCVDIRSRFPFFCSWRIQTPTECIHACAKFWAVSNWTFIVGLAKWVEYVRFASRIRAISIEIEESKAAWSLHSAVARNIAFLAVIWRRHVRSHHCGPLLKLRQETASPSAVHTEMCKRLWW